LVIAKRFVDKMTFGDPVVYRKGKILTTRSSNRHFYQLHNHEFADLDFVGHGSIIPPEYLETKYYIRTITIQEEPALAA